MSQAEKKQKGRLKEPKLPSLVFEPMVVATSSYYTSNPREAILAGMPKDADYGPMNVMQADLAAAALTGRVALSGGRLGLESLKKFIDNWCQRRSARTRITSPFTWSGGENPQFRRIDTILLDDIKPQGNWDCAQEMVDVLVGNPKSIETWWLSRVLRDLIEEYEIRSQPVDPDDAKVYKTTTRCLLPDYSRWVSQPKHSIGFLSASIGPFGEELSDQRKKDIEWLRALTRGEPDELDVKRLWPLLVERHMAFESGVQGWASYLEQDYLDHKNRKQRPAEWEQRKADASFVVQQLAESSADRALALYLEQYYPEGYKRVCVLDKKSPKYLGNAWQWHPAVRHFAHLTVKKAHGHVSSAQLNTGLQRLALSFLLGKVRLFKP